jgi:hypothetical protein
VESIERRRSTGAAWGFERRSTAARGGGGGRAGARVPRAGALRGVGPAVRSSAGRAAQGGPAGSGGAGRDNGREKRGREKRKGPR